VLHDAHSSPFSKHVLIETAEVGLKSATDKRASLASADNKSVLISLLEQQVRVLEDERDSLCQQKAEMMREIAEYRQMADSLAIQVKEFDKVKSNELNELDDYVEKLEAQLEQQEQMIESQDSDINELIS